MAAISLDPAILGSVRVELAYSWTKVDRDRE